MHDTPPPSRVIQSLKKEKAAPSNIFYLENDTFTKLQPAASLWISNLTPMFSIDEDAVAVDPRIEQESIS
jgi:hypothetical protein